VKKLYAAPRIVLFTPTTGDEPADPKPTKPGSNSKRKTKKTDTSATSLEAAGPGERELTAAERWITIVALVANPSQLAHMDLFYSQSSQIIIL
jgi:hypothetical protein